MAVAGGKIQKAAPRGRTKQKVPHEKSRVAKRENREILRAEKLKKQASTRNLEQQPYLQRIDHIRKELKMDDNPATIEEMHQVVADFIARNDDDIYDIEQQRRPGRPPTTREVKLKQSRQTEEQEYSSGFWVPDLTDADNLQTLHEWDGEWSALGLIKFCRVVKDGSVKSAGFPPTKGS